MRTFWDTSAAINALVSAEVFSRLDSGEHFARIHLLSEFFSTLTKRGITARQASGQPFRLILTASDAARWLWAFAAKVTFVELTAQEVLDGFDHADERSVVGPKVYDFGHAMAADKVLADELLTRNSDDFAGLTRARIEWP
jgi:hypothetical protein